MPKKTITKESDKNKIKTSLFNQKFIPPKNVSWTVKTGKVTVATGSRKEKNYGPGCELAADSEVKATMISITSSDKGKVVIHIDY